MIEVTNVTKIYGEGDQAYQALKGVSFRIESGEFVAIMGPSGSGKSTLMHILGALDVPSSGTYFLDGKDVSRFTEDELADVRLRNIGYVFQSFNLLPRATVLRNVTLPLIYRRVPRRERIERARNALRSVGMEETHDQHFSNQISGGQMQRVAIARALINEPKLILADEPTGNLDSKTGEMVLATFERLHASGHTIVLITHEHDVAEHASRVLHIRDGQIVREEKTK